MVDRNRKINRETILGEKGRDNTWRKRWRQYLEKKVETIPGEKGGEKGGDNTWRKRWRQYLETIPRDNAIFEYQKYLSRFESGEYLETKGWDKFGDPNVRQKYLFRNA